MICTRTTPRTSIKTSQRRKFLITNAPKSSFCETEIEYLGYMITPTGIKPIPKKIEAVTRLQRPKTVKQLKSFLGMVNFYRDTWAKRSHILAPLSDLISELGAKKNKQKRLAYFFSSIEMELP